MHTGSGPYGIPLFDALDYYLPALLYDRHRFRTVPHILNYIHQQAQYHLNPFSRAEREWRQSNRRAVHQPPVQPPADTEIFTSVLGSLFGATATNPLTANPLVTVAQMDLTNLVGGGIDLTPVTVRPTQTQLDRATDLEVGNIRFSVDETRTCTICQETVRAEGTGPLRRIRYCGHTFHQNCIDTWFTSHVRCPVCRHDIRENMNN